MRMRQKRAAMLAGLLILAAAFVYWFAWAGSARTAPGVATAVPVIVAEATTRDMPIWLASVGTVQALNVVNVRARVEGQLQKVDFVEGQEVRAGDPLAQIDPRPLRAQLRQAEANLQKDEAQLAHARSEVVRYTGLAEKGFVAPTTVDALKTQEASLAATVEGDRAMIDTARLQLSFTTITAPITGRVGMRQADPGAMIRATDPNGLVTIEQVRPIAVSFALPQDELPEILAQRAQGKLAAVANSRDGARLLGDGELSVIDNQVDPTTGQIKLKAVFANADGALWPGQLVTARVLLRTERNAVVVPARAVLSGQDGPYVYVVKSDSTVEPRKVTRGPTVGDFTAIRKGLAAGEALVLDGQSRLAPGTRVERKRAPEAAAPEAPA
jgi:multidrug efflux system membrane fusion protein